MASRAIKPKRDDDLLANWESTPETAPSIVREGTPAVARFFALLGLILVALGTFAIIAPFFQRQYIVGPGLGIVALSLGLLCLLYHALTDPDVQYRMMYLIVGYIGVLGGVLLWFLPLGGSLGALFLPAGVPSMLLGLIFVLTAIRHETDPRTRMSLCIPVGVLGLVMVFLAGFAGNLNTRFLMTEGILIAILGLLYVGAFIGTQENGSDVSYYMGLTLGAVGACGLVAVLVRALLGKAYFFIPAGLVLMTLGLLQLFVALCICVDWPFLVVFRRDLRGFFFSPIGHLVFLGSVLLAWLQFVLFVQVHIPYYVAEVGGVPAPVRQFLLNFVLLIAQAFLVPVLTMRLLSEEHRTGTLEVLLTAPVSETSVVLGKFLAAFVGYLITWLPWFAFLIALRIYTGTDFDYRPLLSFLPALLLTGMSFLAIGLFFSALTSNQVIAAVLTFVAMIIQVVPAFRMAFQISENSLWNDVLTYISPLDLWLTALQGTLAPRMLLYPFSLTVFFLFLTTRMLESRRWT